MYRDHFKLVDDSLASLDSILSNVTDPFFRSRLTGLVAVGAVTAYELAIKTILTEFARKKHTVFGSFIENHYDRLNGRITLAELRGKHIKRFGEKYARRFEKLLKASEDTVFQAEHKSVQSSYSNIITWRNEFAHAGQIPQNATYEEVRKAYELGKEVIRCLADSMKR